MREFLKVLPLGLLLPVVIGAASVKPDDAISNIGAWAHTLGFESASRWLANPAADNRVIVASMAVSVLYAFVMFTLPALKEHRKNPSSEQLKTHFLTMGFYIFCAVLVVSIWRFIPGPRPLPIVPAPQVTPTPKPPEPWVSEEEFQSAKKNGHFLLPFRAEELSQMNFMLGSQGTSAYVGKWVKINNRFLAVRSLMEDKKEYLIVTILQAIWPAYLIFDAKKWGDQILSMNPKAGAVVHALCQLEKYDKEPRDTDAPKFIGSNCELL